MSATVRGAIIGAAAVVVLLIAIALIVIFTGAYNVAATDRHNPIVASALDTTFHNSVESRADRLEAPEFTRANLRAGAQEFAEYCVHCHGAPGVEPHGWASGMTPNPPPLARAARRWEVEEIYWIVNNGVKMSGMPPFGDTHDAPTIWNIAGFVETLPGMTPAEYLALTGGIGHSHGEGTTAHAH